MTQRTPRQNRSLHMWLRMVADDLNNAGLDQRKVLKPEIAIPLAANSKSDVREAVYD